MSSVVDVMMLQCAHTEVWLVINNLITFIIRLLLSSANSYLKLFNLFNDWAFASGLITKGSTLKRCMKRVGYICNKSYSININYKALHA